MPEWLRRLWETDTFETLEYLRDEAVIMRSELDQLPKEQELLEGTPGALEFSKYQRIEAFKTRVEQKCDELTKLRVDRILRLRLPRLFKGVAIEEACEGLVPSGMPELWVDTAVGNIEREIDGIERRREQILIRVASGTAVASAITSVISVAIAFVALWARIS